jgi:hypothetical protein
MVGIVAETEPLAVPAREAFEPPENLQYQVD